MRGMQQTAAGLTLPAARTTMDGRRIRAGGLTLETRAKDNPTTVCGLLVGCGPWGSATSGGDFALGGCARGCAHRESAGRAATCGTGAQTLVRFAEKGERYWAQQVAIQGEEAGEWVAFAEHRTYDALRLLKLAADHEDAAEKHSVTPGAVRPAWELLGDLLMEMPKEALMAYRQVLSVARHRRNTMKGAAEAERANGK